MLDFQDLYQTYFADVYRFSYWLCGNAMDADDLSSETFLRAWTHRERIHTETFRAYLLAIARNVYLERQRKQKPQDQLTDTYADQTPNPTHMTENRFDLATINEALQRISEPDRTAFILRVQHELPYDEIARVLGLSLSATKVKVHRIRLKISNMFGDK